MKKAALTLALATALASLAGMSHAASIVAGTATFAPTTELITFNGYDGLAYDSVANPTGIYLDADGDVLFSTTGNSAMIGAFIQDLGENGAWGARFDPTPTGTGNFLSATAPVMFSFGADGGQAQVGAFFNASRDLGATAGATITLTAYGQDRSVLESFSHVVTTPFDSYNEGVFLGFARTQADIWAFGVSTSNGQSLTVDELHLSVTAVPEPGTWALMAGGLALLAGAARRRRA